MDKRPSGEPRASIRQRRHVQKRRMLLRAIGIGVTRAAGTDRALDRKFQRIGKRVVFEAQQFVVADIVTLAHGLARHQPRVADGLEIRLILEENVERDNSDPPKEQNIGGMLQGHFKTRSSWAVTKAKPMPGKSDDDEKHLAKL